MLTAQAYGIVPSQRNTPDIPGVTSPALQMADTLPAWLDEYNLSHRPESHSLMKQTLEEFAKWVKKTTITTITRVDLLRFKQHLIDKGRSQRTAANKCLRINQFIRSVLKLDPGKGLITVKDMKFTEPEVSVFNDDELEAFFKHCDSYRFAIFKTYLMAGLRKAELENLLWDDVDFIAGVIRVTSKKDWQPKTWEARDIEVPDELLKILKELPRRGKLVFANSNGNKYTHSWDDCMRLPTKLRFRTPIRTSSAPRSQREIFREGLTSRRSKRYPDTRTSSQRCVILPKPTRRKCVRRSTLSGRNRDRMTLTSIRKAFCSPTRDRCFRSFCAVSCV
jgi:integrase